MAAHNYREVDAKRLKFPCIAQTKLDGLRAVAKTGVIYSRKRKIFEPKEHIAKELEFIFKKHPTWFLDGEFYVHNKHLQTINSLVKNPTGGEDLEYHIFDCFYDLKRPLMLRVSEDLAELENIVKKNNLTHIKIVKSYMIQNVKDIEDLYKNVLKQGYEGLMLKNLDGMYEASLKRELRSYNILKYKPDFDAEFKVVGVKEGKGKDEGAIIFILETSTHKQFSARPRDIDTEMRKLLYTQAKKYPKLFIGKMATIKYESLSKDGVPQRLSFKVFREYIWEYFLEYKG